MTSTIRNCCKCIKKYDSCVPFLITKRKSYQSVRRPDINKLKIPSEFKGLPLTTLLSQKIKLSGPLSVADYMKEVLTNPADGYYMKKDVFGARGDFITSPEISQVFGDILGVWFVTEWEKLGKPQPLQIVELGPGRGTLLNDILRITKQVGLDKNNLSLHLVEVSPVLQKVQADKLCVSFNYRDGQPYIIEGETLSGCKIYWYKNLKDVPHKFSFFIAHEFFDALPIHKFKKTEEGWREIMIDLDPSVPLADSKDLKLRYVLSRNATLATKVYVGSLLQHPSQEHLEVSPMAITIAKELANRVNEDGGIALIADYGQNLSDGDTFRAFKNHTQTDPLKDVGSSDLTADVDFDQLKKAAAEARVFGPITQRQFLEASFAQVRLQMILKNANSNDKEILKSSYEMLTDPAKMGEVFKFMALFPTINDEHYKKFPVRGFT